MEENICVFSGKNGSCGCLKVEQCSGHDEKCKFYKTKEQYIKEADRAIDICREKGLCALCKYRYTRNGFSKPACKKSCEQNRGGII